MYLYYSLRTNACPDAANIVLCTSDAVSYTCLHAHLSRAVQQPGTAVFVLSRQNRTLAHTAWQAFQYRSTDDRPAFNFAIVEENIQAALQQLRGRVGRCCKQLRVEFNVKE
jgi:hypothetical protein